MKQPNVFTKFSLLLLTIGAGLSFLGYILGGWGQLQEVKDQFQQEKTILLGQIKSVNLYTSLLIRTGKVEAPTLTYIHHPRYPKQDLHYQVQDGQLSLNDPSGFFYNSLLDAIFFLQDSPQESYRTILTLPEHSQLDSLTGAISDGQVQLKNMVIDELNLSLDSSDFLAEETTFHSTHLFVTDGQLKLKGVDLEDLDFSTTDVPHPIHINSGNLTASDLSIIGKYQVSLTDGNADVTINEQSLKDLTITADSLTGDVLLPPTTTPSSKNQLQLYAEDGSIIVK